MGLFSREATLDDIEQRFTYCDRATRNAWACGMQSELEVLWGTGGLFGVALDGPVGRTQALALAGFLTPDFSEYAMTSRRPYLVAAASDWVRSDRPPILPNVDQSPEAIAQETSVGGLHMHIFEFHWEGPRDDDTSLADRAYLGQAFQERYWGCRLRLLTLEVHPVSLQSVLRGEFQVLNHFPEAPESDQVKLCGVNRDIAARCSQFWLMHAFATGRPIFVLSHRQRRILFYFRLGLADEEIARRVYLSPKSMKTNWDRIFEAASLEIPSIFEGKSKRRAMMDYLRTHPEETWPYDLQADPKH